MSEAISTHDHDALHMLGRDRAHALAVTAAIRLAAGVAFLGIGSAWTYTHGMSAGLLVFPLLAYVVLAVIVFAFRSRAPTLRLFWVMPFIDIGLAFIVHYRGIVAERHLVTALASWSVSSLGVYTLAAVLIWLSMPIRLAVVLTLLSAGAESVLLTAAGLSLWPVLLATLTLGFVAVATSAVPRNAEAALQGKNQAATANASLARLQEQNRQLDLLQREKDALLEIIVHDMRSPIGGALLSLEYLTLELKKHPSQAPLLEATDDAVSTLNSLSAMISQILDMSKLESGRITLRLDMTELRPILEGTMQATSSRARSRSIAVTFDAPLGLKAAVDLRLFPRALEILTTHSLRYTPEGGRILLVASGGLEEVRVSIHSTASAIPKPERLHVFDKFPFATTNESRRTSVWGLGLYFSRLVVAAHQGSISVDDVDGWSTSFVIRLPAERKTS